MKSLQRMFSGRKGNEDSKESSPNGTDSNMHQAKTKSFWKRISPKSVTYFSKSSNKSGEDSGPQSPPPIINSPDEIITRPTSYKANSLDSLDLRHDVPRMRLSERPLSPEDMGMIRYEEDDEEINNQQEHHLPPPPAYEEVFQPPPAPQQSQYQKQNSVKTNNNNNEVFRMGSQNRSDSLGIKYVDADDFSSDEEEGDIKPQGQPIPSQRTANNPSISARKSSHNISQHAIDALLGMSTKSQDHPAQQQQKYKGPHNSFQQHRPSKTDETSANDVPIFAISSDQDSEMDMHPQRLFDNRPVDRDTFNNANNYNLPINNNSTISPAHEYESTRPISIDVAHQSSGSGNNINQTKSPEKERYSATRRIASPPTSRPASDSSMSSSVTQTMTLPQSVQGTAQHSPSMSISTPLMHSNIRQTVPFDGSVPPESPAPTERSVFFPPQVSPSDVIHSRQTPPQQQGRNPSPQRLPSRRIQSAQSQTVSSAASVATAQTSSNVRPQVTRQGSAQRRPLATSSTELTGPGVISVPPMQRQQSLGVRRGQQDQDINNARRRSMSPPAVNATGTGANNRLSLQSNRNLASQSQHQSQYGNMNLSSMSMGNIVLPANATSSSNAISIPTMMNNNLALQQAILQQQQMQQLQQQQLQQLQQQQQQLQLMAAMGMATVPMVAANGMIYQQPIMTVMQNNAIAMNSLTNSLTATAASLALISASATAVPAAPAPILPVAPAVTGLLPSSFPSNATTTSLEEQLLNRQRQVERENDMQLHMAIEQSLQETYHHQPSQQNSGARPVAHRQSSATMSSTSSVSSAISGGNNNLHHNSHQQQSRLVSNNNSTAHSRSMSPSNNLAHRRPSFNGNSNRPNVQASNVVDDDADDAALQLALMMSLEEQLHEQQFAYEQVTQFEQHNQTRSRSPPIREQQRQLFSRQSSRHASPGVHHGSSVTSTSPMNSSGYGQSHENLRAPSRERLVQYQRRSREEILQERQSRSASPAVATGQQHQYGAPLSRPASGVTSRAASNHSSFHEDHHHVSTAPPSYQEVSHHHHHHHPLLPPSYTSVTENHSRAYSHDAMPPPEYTAFPNSPPNYAEYEAEPKAYIAKTLVRRSVSTERAQAGRA